MEPSYVERMRVRYDEVRSQFSIPQTVLIVTPLAPGTTPLDTLPTHPRLFPNPIRAPHHDVPPYASWGGWAMGT